MKRSFSLLLIAIGLTLSMVQCKKKDTNEPNVDGTNPPTNTVPPINESTNVRGYQLLQKITGIWNGPITSSTTMGSFAEAPMDFRPISASQVSTMNELDPDNSVFMSFFIIYTGTEYQVAFRNGGTFAGMIRSSYMKLDSVSESSNHSYYRFVDFKKAQRTITEVTFNADSLRIKAFTNKTNTLSEAVVHMDYKAKKQYDQAHQTASNHFGFPKKEMVKDFSTTFNNQTETVFYSTFEDPYSNDAQPYLGKANLSYSVAQNIQLQPDAKIVLMVSTEPLISGMGPNAANFKTRSRYIVLNPSITSHNFIMMHPGAYFYYALVDNNDNGLIDSGDYVSAINATFTLEPESTATLTTQINFLIP